MRHGDPDTKKPRPPEGGRDKRLIIAATIVLLLIGASEAVLVVRALYNGWIGPLGQDYTLYQDFTQSWLSGRGWYLPEQLAGPYIVEQVNGNVYPPVLLYLTVPFALGLPAVLWWAIPIGIVAYTFWRVRPAWWAWAVLALAFVYLRTWILLMTGNPSMWAIAFAVAGVAWGWPAVGAMLKLTLGPLALIGVHRRSWWLALGLGLLLAIPFWTMWVDYFTVLRNTLSERGWGYILGEWPIALALVAVGASGLPRRPLKKVGPVTERAEEDPRHALVTA